MAAASHELRTPLASTAVLVDGLLADAHPDPVKTREYLQLIAAENTRLSRLVENFLTFARVDRGGLRLVLGPVDPAAVVREAIDSIGPRVPDAGALRVEVPDDLPRVLADSDALRGALVNLIDNALKYTAAEKRIVVRAQADGAGHVRVRSDRQRHRHRARASSAGSSGGSTVSTIVSRGRPPAWGSA